MPAPRQYNVFGPDYYEGYLKALEESGGLHYASCKAVGCRPTDVMVYRKENPDFADLCREVEGRCRDRVVQEVIRRGIEGVDKVVIGGRDRNEIVHVEKFYSDQLLLALAKRCPDGSFTERQEVTHKGEVGVTQKFDYSKLSPRAREALRAFCQVLVEEEEAKQAVPTPISGDNA